MLPTVKHENTPKLAQKIRSHLVLLCDQKSHEVGSGVLVKMKDHLFVLTAAHVVFSNLHINFGSPYQSTSLTIVNKWINENLDVGFIELKPFEVELFRNDELVPYEIAKRNKTEIFPGKRSLAICGYPSVAHYKIERKIGFIPAFLGCTLIHPENWPDILYKKGKDPDQNIAIPYGKKHGGVFYDLNKQPLPEINPHGLSGCGIWYYIPEDKKSENPRYALFGILTSYFHQSQVLVGTTLSHLINEIKSKYSIPIDMK